MAETKYGKYILTELKLPKFIEERQPPEPEKYTNRILFLDNEAIEGAFYLSSAWYLKYTDKQNSPPPHTHDYDEVVAFLGSDPYNPLDLGGEIEFWLDGEQHIITRSCLIFIPKGLTHCPYWMRKVDRPILHFSTAPMGTYMIKETDK